MTDREMARLSASRNMVPKRICLRHDAWNQFLGEAVRTAIMILLLAGTLHAQDLKRRDLPAQPEPVAYLGQCLAPGEAMPAIPADMVIDDGKCDGRHQWVVKRVDSCAFCGEPMTMKQAAFDKKAFPLWAVAAGLRAADIEITHHNPCFIAGTCRESDPLIGQTRAQGYAVLAAITAVQWYGDAWVRKGDRKWRIGGARKWWIIPVIDMGTSSAAIAANLARWTGHPR